MKRYLLFQPFKLTLTLVQKETSVEKKPVQSKAEDKVWLMFSCFHLQNI